MKTHNALAALESQVSEKATLFDIDADSARKFTEGFHEGFQTVRRWTKPFADRPTPDDWPIDD
jgi:hypothetical protein